jgi:predicted TPR repeat methyltransferase
VTDDCRNTIARQLAAGISFHRQNRIAEAEPLYRQVLARDPDNADALHFYGILKHQQGHSDEAVELIRSAIAREPDNAGMRSNLGNVLKESGRLQEAEVCYREVIGLLPGFADAHCNLGVVLRVRGDRPGAIESLHRAIACDPGHVESHLNLGIANRDDGSWMSAIDHFSRALEHSRSKQTRDRSARLLTIALLRAGQIEDARLVLRRWLEAAPENPIARHMLAAVAGEDVPFRASDDYVRAIFDEFADSFDTVLDRLHYQAPRLVAVAFRQFACARAERPDVLDAACGTGLVGELIGPLARRLLGVDLSSGMLARAAKREVYDQLIEAELTAYLATTEQRFDAITCADSLNYFGDLREVLHGCRRVLAPGGWFCFTLEKMIGGETGSDYELQANGRYRHAGSYVHNLLEGLGFMDICAEEMHGRVELGEPVECLLFVARLPA